MDNPGENGIGEGAEDPKFEQAVFGREVEHFIGEDKIGAYLILRAREDLAQAQEKLIECDPTDARQIASLQLNARVANRVREWLREAIESGRAAEVSIQQERDEHGR